LGSVCHTSQTETAGPTADCAQTRCSAHSTTTTTTTTTTTNYYYIVSHIIDCNLKDDQILIVFVMNIDISQMLVLKLKITPKLNFSSCL